MKTLFYSNNGYRAYEIREATISRIVEEQCNGDGHDRGSLEAARATADYTSELLGKLIAILTETGRISYDDLESLLDIKVAIDEESLTRRLKQEQEESAKRLREL